MHGRLPPRGAPLMSLMIQQLACPSCGRVQSLNMGAGGNFCLNCRHHWREARPLFTEAELQRLVVYRRAIAAGFFTDWS